MTRRILGPGVVIAGLEACWLYALLLLLHTKSAAIFPAVEILFFYAVSYLYHALAPWPRHRWLLREVTGWLLWAALLTGWMMLVPAGAWPDELARGTMAAAPPPGLFAATAFSGVLWFMGHLLGNRQPSFPCCLGKFQFGVAVLVIIYVVDAQLHILVAPLFPATVVFFVLGLTGLLLARANEGTHASQEHRRSWRFLILAGSLILILGAAFWIFSVIKVGLLAWILSTLSDIGHYLVRLVSRFFAFLTSFFPEPEAPTINIKDPPVIQRRDPPVAPESGRISDILIWIGRMSLFLGLLGIVLAVLWVISGSILNWLRKRLALSNGAEEESLPGAFREDLMWLIRAIFARIAALIERFRLRFDRRPLDPGIVGVRQAYRRLLAWAAAGGCVRKPARTPDEHLGELTAWLPEARGELAYITGQYVRARYGPGPVGEEIVRELTSCLGKVRRIRRRRKMHRPFAIFRRRYGRAAG